MKRRKYYYLLNMERIQDQTVILFLIRNILTLKITLTHAINYTLIKDTMRKTTIVGS